MDATEAEGDLGDPIAYVLSANLHRRHLNESQLGMIGAKVANLRHGTNQHATKEDGPVGPSSKKSVKTQTEAAAEVGVGVRTIKRAKSVITKAVPDIVAAIEAGHVTLRAAE